MRGPDTVLHGCYTVLMFLFCFFKQKTAYEMRISDWSSDVCSSDLQEDGRQHRAPEIDGPAQDGEAVAARLEQQAAGQLLAQAAGLRQQGDEQIGRASWRERVCQYV